LSTQTWPTTTNKKILTAVRTGTQNHHDHANKADLGAKTKSAAEMEFQANWEKFKDNLEELSAPTKMTGHTDKDNRALIKNLVEAAKKSIPRGEVKDHKVLWSTKLEKLRQTRNKCRDTVVQQPTKNLKRPKRRTD